MMRRFGGWVASALTRVLLWMYPSSFRQEMGRQMEDDVRRRAGEFEGVLAPVNMVAWLVWLSGSLVVNAVGAWREVLAAPSPRRVVGRSGPFSWLDVKLGLRMLLRNPALTVVSIITLSIGIPASLIPVHGMNAAFAPLPFEEGDRIVEIRNWNVVAGRVESRSLHDFFLWRDQLTTFEALGAARTASYNVMSEDGRAAPLPGAELTASGFRIVRVSPLMGRTLIESDELPVAADVVVISHDLWQARLGSDPNVLGKIIWAAAAVYVCCAAMRLARFNLEITTNDRGRTKQFHGLPTPGAAGALAGLIALHQHLLVTKFGDDVPSAFVRGAALGIPVIMLICGIVMVSNSSYVHVTNRFVRGRRSFAYAARLIIPLALLVWFLEETLAVAFTGYALSGPARLLVARFRRRRSTESKHPSDPS